MRALIRFLDRLLARLGGIYEFWQDPQNILRLQIARARHPVSLPGLQVQPGDPVLMLHFWNSRLPPVSEAGASLTWAIDFRRRLIRSFQGVAWQLETDPRLANLEAVGAVFSLLPAGEERGGQGLVHRLGFTVLPYRDPLGRLGEWVENIYSWLLIWAYNPGSLVSRKLFHLYRFEIWVTREEFLNRYLTEETHMDQIQEK
jgi:hypothetical protein